MNGLKSTVILALSIIIIVQSAFLVYFMHRANGVSRGGEKAGTEVAQKSQAKKPFFGLDLFKPRPASSLISSEKILSQEPLKQGPSAPAVVPVPVPAPERPKISPPGSQGRIALVLDDWGYSLRNKGFITNNDYHVTLSILPGKPYSNTVAMSAFEKNKDTIVHMPMEPHDKSQYGLEENTLLVGMDKGRVFKLLKESFDSVPHAKGLSNHMGSYATEDGRLMKMVMEYLKKNNMFFFDSLVTTKTVGLKTARQFGVSTAARDVFIDNEDNPVYIRHQILKLAERARQTGLAFGIGHDRPHTIEVLEEMIPRLEEEGYKFVNLSEVVS